MEFFIGALVFALGAAFGFVGATMRKCDTPPRLREASPKYGSRATLDKTEWPEWESPPDDAA